VRRLGGGGHARRGQVGLVDRPVALAGEVLDRRAGQPCLPGQANRLGDLRRCILKPVLQIGGHRERSRLDELGRVAQRLLPRDRAVDASQRRGVAAARGGQGLEAERGQDPGRAHIPRVGQQQGLTRSVQLEEMPRLRSLLDHVPRPL
jgi:hypothetical protein